jgi:hypothetical protein
MKLLPFALCLLPFALPCCSQVFTFTREQLIEYTAQNPYARFEDGRPKVPDDLLAKCKDLSAEEVWAVLPGEKFRNQYEGNWQILHPERKLVGRAVTAQFMPFRPDVGDVMEARARPGAGPQCQSTRHRFAATRRCIGGGPVRQNRARHNCR